MEEKENLGTSQEDQLGTILASQLDLRMQELAKTFPGNIEFSGYFVGDNLNTLTNFILPRNVIGLDVDWEDKIKLKELTDPLGLTSIMIGVDRMTGELGIQVVASKDGAAQDKSQFFPLSQLILNKPLASYFSDQMMEQRFPELSRDDITNELLLAYFEADKEAFTHTYFDNGTPYKTVNFVSPPLEADMFGGKRSLHPMNAFTLDALAGNKAGNGKIFGISHIHFGHTEQEIEKSRRLRELYKFDEKFMQYLSAEDYLQMLEGRANLLRISKGQCDMSMKLLGVTALDPVTKEIVGRSYYSPLTLLPDSKAETLKKLEELAIRTNTAGDVGAEIEFFSLLRSKSPPKFPSFVASITEGKPSYSSM